MKTFILPGNGPPNEPVSILQHINAMSRQLSMFNIAGVCTCHRSLLLPYATPTCKLNVIPSTYGWKGYMYTNREEISTPLHRLVCVLAWNIISRLVVLNYPGIYIYTKWTACFGRACMHYFKASFQLWHIYVVSHYQVKSSMCVSIVA